MTGRLLHRGEVAERLSVSVMTVRRLAAAGHLDEIRVGDARSALPRSPWSGTLPPGTSPGTARVATSPDALLGMVDGVERPAWWFYPAGQLGAGPRDRVLDARRLRWR